MVKGGPRYEIIQMVLEPLTNIKKITKQDSPINDQKIIS